PDLAVAQSGARHAKGHAGLAADCGAHLARCAVCVAPADAAVRLADVVRSELSGELVQSRYTARPHRAERGSVRILPPRTWGARSRAVRARARAYRGSAQAPFHRPRQRPAQDVAVEPSDARRRLIVGSRLRLLLQPSISRSLTGWECFARNRCCYCPPCSSRAWLGRPHNGLRNPDRAS